MLYKSRSHYPLAMHTVCVPCVSLIIQVGNDDDWECCGEATAAMAFGGGSGIAGVVHHFSDDGDWLGGHER